MAEIIRFFDRDAATQSEIDERVEHLVLFNSLLGLIQQYGISAVMDAFDQVELTFTAGRRSAGREGKG